MMLEQLDPIPACVQNGRYDLLAYNRTYGAMMCDLDALPPEDRNCLWLAFTHDGYRSAFGNHAETVRLMVARFRADMAEHLAEPAWKALLGRLRAASPEFREIWERHEVVGTSSKTKRFVNARVGELRLEHTNLWLSPGNGSRMVSYAPVDDESHERLERLHTLALAELAES